MTDAQLEDTFAPYRKPNEVTIPKYESIASCTLGLARLIQIACPESREKSTALTQLQAVRMWANAAIAIHTKADT